jgi:hypothetical protein
LVCNTTRSSIPGVGLAVGLGVGLGVDVGCGVDVGWGAVQPAMPEAIARSKSASPTRSESIKPRFVIGSSQCARMQIVKLGASIAQGCAKVNPDREKPVFFKKTGF